MATTTTPNPPRAVPQLANITPLAQLRAGRLGRRLGQLTVGLVFYGISMAMMVRGTLGLDPWDVFHYGVASGIPLTFGGVVIVTGVAVLLLWIPLRQMPGLGTVANAVLIGLATDAALAVLVAPESLLGRAGLLTGGILLNGLATALYIGSQFGPGPRDGLMTGLVRRTGWSVRVVRTSIELTVVAVGWMLGGVVGIGTIAYALAIGPLVQALLPRFVVELPAPPQRLVAISTDESGATMTSTEVNRSSVSHCSRSTSTRPA
ncbi:MAG: YczE/YyaS/YitT family protein [Nocardioidaceae bacterium]